MSTEKTLLNSVEQRGIPAVWDRFGMYMAAVGATCSQLATAVREVWETDSAETRQAVLRQFDELQDTLASARRLLTDQTASHRSSGRWERLDAALRTTNTEEILVELTGRFGQHPYPIVVESTRFNIEYVRRHGFEAFYTMTDQYLAEIERTVAEGRTAFESHPVHGNGNSFPPAWLYTLHMTCVEVPTHCHVCQNVITLAEHALD